jgi:hypothetical protein
MNFVRLGARGLAVLGAIALLVGVIGAGTATSDVAPLTNPKHFFWAQGTTQAASTQDVLTNDLIYHGGNVGPGAIGVEQKPAVYLIWWGPEWAAGFTTEDTTGAMYSSKTLQNYLKSFFQNVGGSPWANIQTQYCAYALAGATNCVGGGGFVTNPKGQLKGVWTDPSPVPDDIVTLGLAQNLVDDPIASEADHDRNRRAVLLRVPHPDVECRRAREPGAHPVRLHPVAQPELAGDRIGRLRDAQRQRHE